jgi:hypothetical protein
VVLGLLLGPPVLLLLIPAAAAFALGMIPVYQFKCPRCARTFVLRWGKQNVFTSRCVHCGYSIRGLPSA